MERDGLDERSKQVLYAVVKSYILKPEPVGSRFVTKRYSFGFSPATIRNIMADLEDVGLLIQPHTSAGRVPTDKGYRFYVDTLLRPERCKECSDMPQDFIRNFTERIEMLRNDITKMFSEVTNTLSTMSNYVGIALPPKPEMTTFNRIDLIRYKGGTVVAILLTEEGIIKNRILQVDSRVTQDDLNRITDYLNTEYSGYTLDEIKSILISRIKHEKRLWDGLITRAMTICEQALSSVADDVFVSGLYDVMNLPDFSDISRIKELSKAIKEKHLIVKLLDKLAETEGVQVVIGDENPVAELKKLSIVASTYKEGNRPMGVIALIGPTRMNYPKAIFMVDAVARCISRTFESD